MPHQNASGRARALAASLPWLGGLLLAIAGLGMVVRLGLPGVATYRSEIEDAVSRFLGRQARIESLEAGWAGWTPYLMLRGFTLFDDAGSAPLLRFAEARICAYQGHERTVELDAGRGRLVFSGASLEVGGPALFAAPLPMERPRRRDHVAPSGAGLALRGA